MNTRISIFLASLVLSSTILSGQSVNWYHGERSASTPFNIGTDVIYEKLLNKKQGRPVVVAVIDSGVDVEHEDLKDVIWINTDEVPDNGIDDDNNGYIDDINGWNFIGGADGTPVAHDTYEMTRLYAAYREQFKDVDPARLEEKEKIQYNEYVKFGKRIDQEASSAKTQYDDFKQRADFFSGVLEHIARLKEHNTLNKAFIDSLSTSFNPQDGVTANIYNYYMDETGSYPDLSMLQADLIDPLQEGVDYFGSKFKYGWNPDYDPRSIVGDNYEDASERFYGNNLVEGPDAMHGTHVSGIIAASRNNEIGMNGVAENVRIMVIRAVPDGDERDKDVANAIRYAVENGASIINMSFGKGNSFNKQVVDDAIRFAEKKDVLIVHAAGNSGEELEKTKNFPNDYFIKPKGFLFWKKKQAKNYISIGASGPSQDANMVADFSNYSQAEVDLFAPGVMMFSSVPNDQYEIQQGTSMAAPVISGVAAILRSHFPTLTATQVKEALMNSTVPNDTMVKKPGTDELVPFSSLSASGGIVDLRSAYIYASQMKGKKKIKKSQKGQGRA